MGDQGYDGPLWCPGCLRPVGQAASCPWCGMGQLGAEAARLRVVVYRRSEISRQQQRLAAEAAALGLEQQRLAQLLAPRASRPSPQPPVAGRAAAWPAREWRPEVVRGVLLGLGSTLVALAALIFAVVAWVRLGDAGRAGLLLGTTLVAVAGTAASLRRLPATAEALGGLALALVLVDWYALRRAGVAPGWSATVWWALGTGTGAVVAAAAGPWLRLQRPAAAVLAQVSAVLAVATTADAPSTLAAGLALVAAAAAAGAGALTRGGEAQAAAGPARLTQGGEAQAAAGPARLAGDGGWRMAAAVLGVGAVVLELAALNLVLQSPAIGARAGGTAAALAVMALAPAVARALLPASARRAVGDGLVALAAGALLASAGVLLATRWASWPLLAAVAVLGAAGVGAGRVLPLALRRGTGLAAGATLVVAMAGLLDPILGSLAAPLAWVADPWTARLGSGAAGRTFPLRGGLDGGYPAAVGLLSCAAAAWLAALPRPGPRVLAPRLAGGVGSAAGVCLLAVLPLAAAWPLWAVLSTVAAGALVAGTGTVLLDRAGRAAGGPAVCTAVLVALAGAWALATEVDTLVVLGLLGALAAVAAGTARGPWLRQGFAATAAAAVLGESGAVVASAGGGVAQAGFAVALAGGAVLVVGAVWRHGAGEGPVTQALGLAGLAFGMLLAAGDGRWLAAALTAAVPALLLAAVRTDRRGYRWCAAAVAVAATWAWLVVAEASILEAYTLPAAAVALAAGAAARRRRPHPGSWLAFGPGLAVALLPSLALAVDESAAARPLLVGGAALLVVLAGAKARLQAPLVLGAVALVGLGLDALAPVAAQLPRWLTIGATGLLLLWLGATAERRLERLRRLRRQFERLEHRGSLPAGP